MRRPAFYAFSGRSAEHKPAAHWQPATAQPGLRSASWIRDGIFTPESPGRRRRVLLPKAVGSLSGCTFGCRVLLAWADRLFCRKLTVMPSHPLAQLFKSAVDPVRFERTEQPPMAVGARYRDHRDPAESAHPQAFAGLAAEWLGQLGRVDAGQTNHHRAVLLGDRHRVAVRNPADPANHHALCEACGINQGQSRGDHSPFKPAEQARPPLNTCIGRGHPGIVVQWPVFVGVRPWRWPVPACLRVDSSHPGCHRLSAPRQKARGWPRWPAASARASFFQARVAE